MIRNTVNRLLDRISDIQATDHQLIALFTATVIARNLLESITSGILFPAPAFIFHFPIAYVFPMLGLTGLMHLFSGYPLRRLIRLMVFAWTLTLLPPLLDLIIGSTTSIGYFPLGRHNAGFFLLNFFNPSVELVGTTTGIRIEAAIGCILAGIFSWAVSKNRRIFRGILTTTVFAPVFLIFFTWPNLVYIIAIRFFPYVPIAQEFYQWHAATTPHLAGSFHYTIFLVDLIPVVFILGWFYRNLNRSKWNSLVSSIRTGIWELSAPFAGLICALIASSGILTFADSVALSGAFISALLILFSRKADPFAGTILWIIALASSIAVGWSTTVFTLLAISLSMIPGPGWISKTLSAPALFFLASSPVGTAWEITVIPVSIFCALSFMTRKPVWGTISGILAILSVIIFPPLKSTAWLDFHSWLTDSVNRNGRQDFALPAATASAGAGGDMLTLARAELAAGDINRARWAYEIAIAEGDSSSDALKIGFNLAYTQEHHDEFDSLMTLALSSPEEYEQIDLAGLLMARATENGDTLAIQNILESAGSSPQLFHAYSLACSVHGNEETAASYARAAISHPDAETEHFAWAIQITALDGGNYDSLYSLGISRFPGSVELMTSRLMAPLSAHQNPDREDLLEKCLLLRPVSPPVLRMAAIWYLESGQAIPALEAAERAIAVMQKPDQILLEIACRASAETGEWRKMKAHAFYATLLYPENDRFIHFLVNRSADEASVPDDNTPEFPSEADSVISTFSQE